MRHLQCKLAEDCIMAGSADLGQQRAGRAERRSGSGAGLHTPARSPCPGRERLAPSGVRSRARQVCMEGRMSHDVRFTGICISDHKVQNALLICGVDKFWKGFSKFELIYFGVEVFNTEVLRRRERATANCSKQLELKFA